jgi:hypothetical protein
MIDDFNAGKRRGNDNNPELPRPVTRPTIISPSSSTSNPGAAGRAPDTSHSPNANDLRHQFHTAYKPGGVDIDSFGGTSDSSDNSASPSTPSKSSKKGFFGSIGSFFRHLKNGIANLSTKQKIILGLALLLLVGGSAATIAMLTKDKTPTKVVTTHKEEAPLPTPPEKPKSPLTGMEVTEEDTKRPVIGVMIENSTFARPQSGLKDAGVVYEAIAEYGITRFLALYQEANPGNIGPVRSARPYYVDWAHAYDAAYGHVGGSPDGLAKIKAEGIRDMDQFFNSGSYHRISQREAPHNVYTSMQNLRDLASSKGWTTSTFTPLARKKEAPVKAVTANSINIAISGPTYNVHYDYDAASNTYLRTMAGQPHTDADSGARLAPKVVIGLATQYSLMSDGYHSTYATTGSGAVKIFQDGIVTEGTWTREGNSNYSFKDANGKEITLNPGQTWITVVGNPADVTYSAPAPAPATPTP